MQDRINFNYEDIKANDQQLNVDREYFLNHPDQNYYVRESLEEERYMSSPYTLVLKIGEHERMRMPLATKHVSRQKIKQLNKIAKKALKKRR